MPPGARKLGGADYRRWKEEQHRDSPARFPTDAEIQAEIDGAGWPARCPRCEADTVAGGWDVQSNQCRECWKSDVHGDSGETALAKELRSDYKQPDEEWCAGIKANGDRCTFDSEIDGYCKVHWRQAVDRERRKKPGGRRVH